jgi:hypothetical protein
MVHDQKILHQEQGRQIEALTTKVAFLQQQIFGRGCVGGSSGSQEASTQAL